VSEQPGLDFAGLLRLLRERALLTQEELAEAAGLSPRGVSDLERGIHRTARKDTAVLLAEALRLSGPARELFVAAALGRAPAAEVLAASGGPPGAGGPGGHAGTRQRAGSPYRGLKAFGIQDAGLFFGREAATTAVLERMAHLVAGPGVLVVSGVSGAGKSSLLAAGVLPRLRAAGLAGVPEAAGWPCVVFTPTRAPLEELALRVAPLAGADAAGVRRGLDADPAGFALTARQAALAAPPGPGREDEREPRQRRVVLVVDQFEELFTQCDQEGQRRAFITALHAAASTGHAPAALVVLGVRADFEAHCADYPQLAGAVQDRYLVTAMTERQLRMAITEPAKKAGSRVDDDLAGVLLGEVRNGQPGIFAAGVLPLLSHALDQSWRSRTGTVVTLADYERAGGIEGAVAASAQRAYDQLTPAQQTAARQVFTRLAATSTEGIDSADRATRADLTAGKTPAETADVEQVLEAFAAERLLTLAAGTVELSHEVLLTAWPLLRDTWLADTHADRIARTRLRQTAAEWDHHARDPSYLYTGTLLQAAAGAAARIGADPARHPPLGQAERDFLHASDRAHHRRARRRQGVLALLIALVIGFAAVAVLAVRAGEQAAHQRDIARSGQLASQSQLLGDANPVLARLLAVAAWRLSPSSATRYAMLAAAALPGIRIVAGHGGPVRAMAFSPGGKTLAVGSEGGTLRLWDVATGRPIHAFGAGHGAVMAVAFGAGGRTLAAGAFGGPLRLREAAAGRVASGPLILHAGTPIAAALSEDGKTLAVANGRRPTAGNGRTGVAAGTVRLWDVADGQPIGGPFTSHVASVALNPDGTTVATGYDHGTVRLWEAAIGQPVGGPLTTGTSPVVSVAFSPDGTTLATGSADGTVRLWDAASHELLSAPFNGYRGPVNSVAFSPDGKTLATGYDDGKVRLWQVAIGRPIGGPLTSGTSPNGSVAFSPDGKTVAIIGLDGTPRLWDLVTGRPAGRPLTSRVASLVFSANARILATIGLDDTVRLWDVANGRLVGATLTTGTSPVVSLALFSPDGKTLATIGPDGTVRLWNVATSRPFAVLSGLNASGTTDTSPVVSMAFSPDGRSLATGSKDGTVQLWDVATHRPAHRPDNGGLPTIVSVAFSPDGTTLATGSNDGTVQLWGVATGRPIGGPLTTGTSPVVSVAFGSDGTTLATGSKDGTVQLWDIAAHQPIGGPLIGGTGTAVSVVFGGDTLATRRSGGTTRLWNVAYLDVVKHLCASAGRSLTPAEWAHYLPGLAYETTCPSTPARQLRRASG
jgi:WD40 repeat protein/transcriptional regulator with XRE-family HTH domain